MTAHAAPLSRAPGWTPARLGVAALMLLAALWLGWKAWDVNITMSCWKNEWPHLPVCEEINGRTPQERVARLQERLAANPGDALALVALTVLAHQPGVATEAPPRALLARAMEAAPQNVDVLRLQASAALRESRWTDALDPLMRLSRHHHNTEATRALAEMVAFGTQDAAVAQALTLAAKTEPGWLDRVLRALPQAKVPTATAMPLIHQMILADALEPRLGLQLIRQLKAESAWLDAHALWLQLWKRPLGFVFNGDFEQSFVAGGFDWETQGPNDHRAGAQVSRVGRKGHGQVLRVNFGGKAFNQPIVRQHLVLPPGSYRLTGAWQTSDLRSEQGLTWVLRCERGQRELGRVPALKTTGRDWQPMALDVVVPADCGLGLALMLQTHAPYEARTGLRGEVVFDDLRLERLPETPVVSLKAPT